MPTDLTERLAAKLGTTVYPPRNWEVAPERVPFDTLASVAHQILPLLLSEPELVASLSDAVRDDVLCVLMSLKAREAIAKQDKLATVCWLNALGRLPDAAMADVAALTPEGKDG